MRLDKKQRDLVADNLWVVKALARKIYSKVSSGRLELEDLEGFGYLALCRCATRFDPGKGVKFSTYSYPRVRGSMLNGIRDQGRTVRLPRTIISLRPKVKELVQEGRSYEQVAEELGVSVRQVTECEQSWREEPLPLSEMGE